MFASISKLFRKSRKTAVEQPPDNQAGGSGIEADSISGQNGEAAADSIGIPYAALLKVVPHNLHGKNASSLGATGKFFIGRKAVIDQLAKGAVRISFGALRASVSDGLFTTSDAQDATLIDLPLSEVIPQLSQEDLARNPRKRIEVPNDVSDLFDRKGGGLSSVRVMAKQEVKRAAVAVPAPPAEERPQPAPEEKYVPASAAAFSPGPPAELAAPAAKITLSANVLASLNEAQGSKPAARPAPAIPAAHTHYAAPKIEGSALVVVLAQLSETWPAAIQQEISTLRLGGATCSLPLSELGKGLKQGKIEIPWKTLRSWITPPASGASPHAEMMVDLPLKTIAPMFMAQNRSAPQPKADVAAGVADVFSRGAAPASAPVVPAPPPTPVATPVAPPAAAMPAFFAPAPSVSKPAERPAAPAQSWREGSGTSVSISLSLFASNWPATLVKDLDPKFLAKAKLEIPVDLLESQLKSGKVEFSWRDLCGWMQPQPPEELITAHEQIQIGLPLSVIAPLFLQRKPTPPKKGGDFAQDIPDVFFQGGTGPDVPPAAAAPAPAPVVESPRPATKARAPIQPDPEPAPEPEISLPAPLLSEPAPGRRRVKDLAELFGLPEKRHWTPNDIVQKTATLPGVSGALIALQDGLLVASSMPADWKTETVAAFLPQIFGRMNQYTKELKMGELYSVTFAVDKGALQIFASGIIYFATLSKPESALPLYELALIAKELSRHTK
jgi:predicted regulator of Ras-like GTPase activity (Roadblock/LC7/MglB family)